MSIMRRMYALLKTMKLTSQKVSAWSYGALSLGVANARRDMEFIGDHSVRNPYMQTT